VQEIQPIYFLVAGGSAIFVIQIETGLGESGWSYAEFQLGSECKSIGLFIAKALSGKVSQPLQNVPGALDAVALGEILGVAGGQEVHRPICHPIEPCVLQPLKQQGGTVVELPALGGLRNSLVHCAKCLDLLQDLSTFLPVLDHRQQKARREFQYNSVYIIRPQSIYPLPSRITIPHYHPSIINQKH
jgi:hypothetical protein